MKQQTLSDMEYNCRKKKTKREEFLAVMDEIIPWEEWVSVIRPYAMFACANLYALAIAGRRLQEA